MSGHILDTDAATEAAELSQQEDAEDVSISDISLIQVSSRSSLFTLCLILVFGQQHNTGTISGKGRLDSLRENLSKQQVSPMKS